MSIFERILRAIAWPLSTRDVYRIETGHAGFVKLYKNGQRIQPKNFTLEFRK